MIKTLKKEGLTHLERYRKAEALVGDSNSIALIDKYFHDQHSLGIVCLSPVSLQCTFLDALWYARKTVPFEQAYDEAYIEFLRKHPDL